MSANIYDKEQKKLIPYAGSTTAILIADYDETNKNMLFFCQNASAAKYDNGNIDFT
jgi:hypothetical protein